MKHNVWHTASTQYIILVQMFHILVELLIQFHGRNFSSGINKPQFKLEWIDQVDKYLGVQLLNHMEKLCLAL